MKKPVDIPPPTDKSYTMPEDYQQQLILQTRQAFTSEFNFIYNSWIKSGYRSNTYSHVDKNLYTLNQHDIVSGLLARAKTLVAHEPGKPENLLGYIVYDIVDNVFVVYYAYTKEMFRKLGIQKILLKSAGYNLNSMGFYTHNTKHGDNAARHVNLFFNPYLLLSPKHNPWKKEAKITVKQSRLNPETLIESENEHGVE